MSIVENRKASHDYFIEERYEAGIALEGWEVKAIRAGRAQIADAYVIVKGADALLSAQAKKLFQEAYPEDALTKLWNRPPESSWLGDLKLEYAEKFKAA